MLPNGRHFGTVLLRLAKMGTEDYGLTVGIHAHAAGFMDFEPELEQLFDEVDEKYLKICFDTGHHSYAGFDPVAFMERNIGRISYMHFKDIDPKVKADVDRQPDRFLRCLRAGHLLQSRRRGCRLSKGAADPSRQRVSKDGARWSRTVIRRWMCRRSAMHGLTVSIWNPSVSEGQDQWHD
jgi:hypothetical protein